MFNNIGMRKLAARIVDEWEKYGPAFVGGQAMLYHANPATYFTWAAERNGADVFGNSAMKKAVNSTVRAEVKRRNMNWCEMKRLVQEAAFKVMGK